jgi:RNA polymerase sigma-70 factor (ECF subfamily)
MQTADEERILAIYAATMEPLYRYVSRSCGGDRALAEDVTQETWLRAIRDWRRKGPPEQPIAWLMTVARNLLVSYYRRYRPAELDAMLETVRNVADADRGPESEQTTAAVNHALSRLPPAQADLIESFHFDRRPTAQIAKDAGLSDRAVEGRLRRARLRLRRELEHLLGVQGGRS